MLSQFKSLWQFYESTKQVDIFIRHSAQIRLFLTSKLLRTTDVWWAPPIVYVVERYSRDPQETLKGTQETSGSLLETN